MLSTTFSKPLKQLSNLHPPVIIIILLSFYDVIGCMVECRERRKYEASECDVNLQL